MDQPTRAKLTPLFHTSVQDVDIELSLQAESHPVQCLETIAGLHRMIQEEPKFAAASSSRVKAISKAGRKAIKNLEEGALHGTE